VLAFKLGKFILFWYLFSLFSG